jgi:MFS family permease
VTGGRRRARFGLLREAGGFRLLFFATLASSIGTWLAFVALVVDVFDRTENASWVSALLVVEFLPSVVVGFMAGRLLDVGARRRILVLADAVRAGVFFVLPFATSALQIVALAFVAGIATSLFRPAVYAGLPNLVPDEDLPQANGLLQTADNFTWAIGALTGGALVAATSTDVAYAVNAVSFIVSACLILRIRESLEEAERAPSRGHWRDLADGLSFALRSKSLVTIIVAWSIAVFATAGVNVAEIVLAKNVFSAGDFGYGLLVAAGAIGLMIGSFFGGSWIEQRGMAIPYGISIALMALGFGAGAVAPNVWVAAIVVVAAGAGNGVAVVTNAVLVQRGAPDRLRGRAFAVVMSLGYAFLGLGMIAAGPLTNEAGPRAVWGASAVLLGIASLTGFLLARRVDAEGARVPFRASDPEPARD